ncbi:hypothetical protein [Dokdonia sp. Hel_I_53]|uniref:hypothetical protein n=1 Tax=Dokdonia sp. Hel_I_53 TaxID=1566287 RepID=UPI00119BD88C|nr:hypothetical protein [Dokdonia sp. Hel_I_53]TVZ52305.1 hypothetical protein OD90_1478 [Dokdonia sp. Hel_I_53]
MADIIKDEEDPTEEYLLQDNKKTRFGATFIVITLIILILAVVATYFVVGF